MKKLKELTKSESNLIDSLRRFYEMNKVFYFSDTFPRTDENSFYAIPSDSYIVNLLARVKKTYPEHKKFVDVGCGVGNIMSVAEVLGYESYGIDAFRTNLELLPYRKTIKDVFECTYDNYDVIYCFQIFKNPQLLEKLYVKIIQEAKPNTIILPIGQFPYRLFDENPALNRTKNNYYHNIYIKK